MSGNERRAINQNQPTTQAITQSQPKALSHLHRLPLPPAQRPLLLLRRLLLPQQLLLPPRRLGLPLSQLPPALAPRAPLLLEPRLRLRHLRRQALQLLWLFWYVWG